MISEMLAQQRSSRDYEGHRIALGQTLNPKVQGSIPGPLLCVRRRAGNDRGADAHRCGMFIER